MNIGKAQRRILITPAPAPEPIPDRDPTPADAAEVSAFEQADIPPVSRSGQAEATDVAPAGSGRRRE
jgi:hypothetical protein